MKKELNNNYYVDVLFRDGTYYTTIEVEYQGKYDSEKILHSFYEDNPQFKSDVYMVSHISLNRR